jgi:hypothetical protein
MSELTVMETDEDDFQLPSYRDPGRILVRYHGPGESVYRHDCEVLDYDGSVFWISEGVGFDFWLEQYVDFPEPGVYVIEGITGEYIRGDGWTTDDDEEWDYTSIRQATEEEVSTETLADLEPR